MLQQIRRLFITFSLLCCLSGCFHIPVQQGNMLTPELAQKIHNGMSQRQVVKILGTPVLNDIYGGNTRYYVYSFKTEYNRFTKKWLIIEFYNGSVARHYMSDNLAPQYKK